MSAAETKYVEILLPLALDRTYTYSIPPDLRDQVTFGKRVEVQFGTRKRYSGLVVNLDIPGPGYKTKEIISVLDKEAIITPQQYRFWNWMASYYCCNPGEVMKAALPGGLMLSSETIIKAMPVEEDQVLQLNDSLYNVYGLISSRTSITLEDLQKISGLSVLYPHVVTLYQLGMILVLETLEEKYSPKTIKRIKLRDEFKSEGGLQTAVELIGKSEKQVEMFLSYLAIAGPTYVPVEPKVLLEKADAGKSVLQSLLKKNILEEVNITINRMDQNHDPVTYEPLTLTPIQSHVVQNIKAHWKNKEVVLLHGVTGSGKTMVYIELINEVISSGGQVLYLVPEIGMSVQLLNRLRSVFGSKITVAHSRLNENERVDVWNQVNQGIPIVAAVRSGIFLPFQNLQLIIVDEEHDASYKQQEPSPRYNARDMAILLGKDYNAKVLLGSATPSVESYFHASKQKYGLVELPERYHGMELPEVAIIDRRKDKSSSGALYSHSLIEEIRKTLENKKQVILFKNRRGYAPVLKCDVCSWVAECSQCDVSLTYHKGRNVLVCHLCGVVRPTVNVCPACGSPRLILEGSGTEKIEDELSLVFKDAHIARMDLDTTRGKQSTEKLIQSFEDQKIDILVGTQMVTKGLDFDHVGLVGVVDADQSLHFPDFRAVERTFQTLVQVSGRAGRKFEQGKVLIQTYQPTHPVFQDVIYGDYLAFFNREIKERADFKYPPFVRQILITLRHKQFDLSREAAEMLALDLRSRFGPRILGPSVPPIGRIRNQYIHQVHIKMEREGKIISEIKTAIHDFQVGIVKKKSLSTLRVTVDVDP
jgi:primosomal protein N' (replication factor Y)